MSYTYDLTTPIGQVRITTGDVLNTAGTAFFTDAELQAFITAASGDTGQASVQALYTWSRRLAVKPDEQIGDYTIKYGAMAKQLSAAAVQLASLLGEESDDVIIGEVGGELWVRD